MTVCHWMRTIRAIAGQVKGFSKAMIAPVRCIMGFLGVLVVIAGSPASAWRRPALPALPPDVHAVAVFGPDDRVPLPVQMKDLQDKIGLLFNLRARSVCTAFCVAPDIIVTAGHCLHRTGGEPPPRLADFAFSPNYEARKGATRLAGAATGHAAQFVLSGAATLNVRPPIEATKDWALIRLEQNACSKGVLPVRAVPTEQVLQDAAQGRVFQVAYHRDFQPWRLAYSKPCAVQRSFPPTEWPAIAQDFADPANLLLHTCDTGGASSGSPLLREGAEGPEVIGISVGTYEESKVEIESGRVVKRSKSTIVANTGVNALVFAAKLDLFRNAQILTAPHQIRSLQGALRQRSHYAGPVNGLYSADLRQAIESFERAQGLTVTGLATQALLRRLQGTAAGDPAARGPG